MSDRPVNICCAWFDEKSVHAEQIGDGPNFKRIHQNFITQRAKMLIAKPRLHFGCITPVPPGSAETSSVIANVSTTLHAQMLALHAAHHETHDSGKTVSLGLVRFANINPLVAVAKALIAMPSPDDICIHYCVYHARHPLAVRSLIEKRLDSAFTRHREEAFWLNEAQLVQWVTGFSQALASLQPTSHKLAKQIYFPVAGDYHLLCPLFATSLTQAMHEKLIAARFGEEAKAIREAHRAGKWHAQADIRYPNLAEMHFGGTKPQNISALNSSRGGRAWLLPSRPPAWVSLQRAPRNLRSIFAPRGEFNHSASHIIASMTFLLKANVERNNIRIRSARAQYVDELIDLLFMQASAFQQEKWQGWSQNCPEMPLHQQLWLDPWRSKADETFRLERDKDDWQVGVADDFARWLNYRLKKASLDVGAVEHKAWRTLPLFRQRMREMDAIVQEALK